MTIILQSFWRMMTFRLGPESIPYNPSLAAICLAIDVLVSIAANNLLLDQSSFGQSFIQTLLILLINGLLIWIILTLRGFHKRFTQTMTAYLGCDLLLTAASLITLPAAAAINDSIQNFVTPLLSFWSIAVFGFIFHKSFDVPISIGVIGAFILIIFSYRLSQILLTVL